MQKNPATQSGIFNSRILLAVALCSIGAGLAMLSFAATPPNAMTGSDANSRVDSPVVDEHARALGIRALPVTASMPFDPVATSMPFGPGAVGMPLAPTAAPEGEWSIVPSPNSPAQALNFLNGVTCVSASDCWAVGYNNVNSSGYRTLIEHWDGSSWSIVPSPNTSATQDNFLHGVTCVSASDCWAVGLYDAADNVGPGGIFTPIYQTLIVRWDGTSWTIVASPNTNPARNNYLRAVTCTSASDCWAVGYAHNGLALQTLVERWNGTSWTIVTSPNTALNRDNGFLGVTCVSASDCWAVGQAHNGTALQTLVERWNGTSWTIVTSPNVSTSRIHGLQSVTCVSASDCWAVGFHHTGGNIYQTLIERWDGTSWATVASPNTSPAESNYLLGVTCVSASDCWAVGSGVERWDGTSWIIVPSPKLSPTLINALKGVTCVSASDCHAVGEYQTVGFYYETLIERWDGTSWAIVPSPDTGATQNNFLPGVTCVSESDCWAVGYSYTGAAYQTLIERWDGTSWTIVPSPNTSDARSNYLYGVTCLSASDCWAVGKHYTGSVHQTLIQRWDGTSWTIVPSPNTSGTRDNSLVAMTCTSASDCWAVGAYSASGGYLTLIERWNGISWAIVTSPNVNTGNYLQGVTCASVSDCWAVGFSSSSGSKTLIERWDGTSWTVVPSPSTAATYNYLNGVTCAAASDCWAVGSSSNGVVSQSIIERWNGTSWAIVTSPTPPLAYTDFLLAVTCTSTSNCWAVGTYSEDTYKPLIKRWDGTSWALVSSPNTNPPISFSSARGDYLQAVTCVSPSDCWATGYSSAGLVSTLTMRFRASLIPTSVVSRKIHGSAGDYNVPLPLTGIPGIECRTEQLAGNHHVVFTFPNAVTLSDATVTPSSGKTAQKDGPPVRSADGKQITVNLKNVSDAQTITISLLSVSDGTTTNDVSVQMMVLAGDTNGDTRVNVGDTNQTKANSGSLTNADNFRTDVNLDGRINVGDTNFVKSYSGSALP